MKPIVAVTGATGLVGTALCRVLIDNGYEVRSISRSAKAHSLPEVKTFLWDPAARTMDVHALDGAETVVNLAGENLADKAWSKLQKEKILESRLAAAQTLEQALTTHGASVQTIIGMSAIGYYAPKRVQIDETDAAGDDFLAQVCQQWEAAQTKMAANRRLVLIRAGLVLSKNGGLYPKLVGPMKFLFGFWFGKGTQVMSWIHIRDLTGFLYYALREENVEGVFNGVAQEPCSQEYFVRYICKYLRRFVLPWGIPEEVVRVLLGDMSQLVLTGSSVSSVRLSKSGFKLKYPYLYDALRELARQRSKY